MTRYFAIGDIHGHHDEMLALVIRLINEAQFEWGVDHLLLLGDLVDNGPKSKEVVIWCKSMKKLYPETFHPLMGNHDDMMIDALLGNSKRYGDYNLWYGQGGKQTIESYLPRNVSDYEKAIMQPLDYIPEDHLEFLASLPRYYETDRYFFCHAGIPPKLLKNIDLEDPDVQEALIWIRSEFYNSNLDFGKKVIFAHTPFEKYIAVGVSQWEPFEKDNLIGLNTMPRNEGKLTCVILNSENDDYEFVFQEKL